MAARVLLRIQQPVKQYLVPCQVAQQIAFLAHGQIQEVVLPILLDQDVKILQQLYLVNNFRQELLHLLQMAELALLQIQ
jgi:hypothetical protein